MKTVTVLVFSDRFRPFSSLITHNHSLTTPSAPRPSSTTSIPRKQTSRATGSPTNAISPKRFWRAPARRVAQWRHGVGSVRLLQRPGAAVEDRRGRVAAAACAATGGRTLDDGEEDADGVVWTRCVVLRLSGWCFLILALQLALQSGSSSR
jgi:hypothetical protein